MLSLAEYNKVREILEIEDIIIRNNILEYEYVIRESRDKYTIYELLIKHNRVSLFIYSVERDYFKYPQLSEIAARYSRIEILDYLHAKRLISENCSIYAATKLDVLKWLISKGYSLHKKVINIACRNGNLDCMIYAWKHDCDIDKQTYIIAAERGYIKILKWLRRVDNKWCKEITLAASKGDHLDVLKWLRSFGCPWDYNIYIEACRRGNLAIIRYAHENKCAVEYERSTWKQVCYNIARDRKDILDFLDSI